jgi:hypothetical protein
MRFPWNARNRPRIALAAVSRYCGARMLRALWLWLWLVGLGTVFSARGQASLSPGSAARPGTNGTPSLIERREQLRTVCLAGRRSICGKILRVLPDGLLVESGYTNLLREPLTKSWLVPGTVVANRAQRLVESREPGALCVGTVFLTDLPRGKPHPYDYVIICGYPSGEYAYTSAGSVRKTVRRFSAKLERAVQANLAAER